ncbi:MAG TPA: DEAD/DEAH box helicase [Polyangiaceae bacterium]|jgi:ATP-dependent RNA helicase DeaD
MTVQSPTGEAKATAPLPTFDALPLSAELRRAIDACGYTHPTPVQVAVFEPASRGKNLVVQARTGTGKTAAFGLPILDALVKKSLLKAQALVLTPTRELALQITRELERLAEFRGTKLACIYGGAPMGKQIEQLEQGAQVVVGTPGRVLDHLRRGTLDPSTIRIFVLDEADEMLSMGFAKELHAIAERLPKERQGLFFSATIPPDIERLAQSQLKDPEFITLSSDQIGALEVKHFVYVLRGGDKRQQLIRILEVEDPESAIVFCNTKDETERLAEALQRAGYDADWLNGDLEQRDRERVMQATREGKLRFLVCTDVASRGIDISHLTHVINADFPEAAESYVHRTGRTGRAGRTGTAISLVTPKDIGSLYILRLTYKIRPIERQLPTDGELKTRGEADLIGMFVDAFADRPVDPSDLSLARRLLTHADAEKIVAGLLRDHLGAKAAAEGDVVAEAAAARRGRNPPPMAAAEPEEALPAKEVRPPEAAPVEVRPQEPRRPPPRPPLRERAPRAHEARSPDDARPPRARERRGVPHKTFATWEPPVDADDDKPILPSWTEEPAGDAPGAPAPTERGERSDRDDPNFAQIFVNVGRRDGARPQDFERLLAGVAGVTPEDTRRIRVRDRNTFVSVRKEHFDKVLAALAGQVIAGRTVIAEPAKQPPPRHGVS